MQSDGSRSSRGWCRLSPKNMKRSKLVGGRERKKGLKRKEKPKKKKRDGPSLERLCAPALTASLGRQRVVVAFAALALAAQHDGSGQEEEWRGDQQEQAKASKNPHHLETDGENVCRTTKRTYKLHQLTVISPSFKLEAGWQQAKTIYFT